MPLKLFCTLSVLPVEAARLVTLWAALAPNLSFTPELTP
jgi:hypothetical protein